MTCAILEAKCMVFTSEYSMKFMGFHLGKVMKFIVSHHWGFYEIHGFQIIKTHGYQMIHHFFVWQQISWISRFWKRISFNSRFPARDFMKLTFFNPAFMKLMVSTANFMKFMFSDANFVRSHQKSFGFHPGKFMKFMVSSQAFMKFSFIPCGISDLPTTRFHYVVRLTPCLYWTPWFHCLSLGPSKEQRQNLSSNQECTISNTGRQEFPKVPFPSTCHSRSLIIHDVHGPHKKKVARKVSHISISATTPLKTSCEPHTHTSFLMVFSGFHGLFRRLSRFFHACFMPQNGPKKFRIWSIDNFFRFCYLQLALTC